MSDVDVNSLIDFGTFEFCLRYKGSKWIQVTYPLLDLGWLILGFYSTNRHWLIRYTQFLQGLANHISWSQVSAWRSENASLEIDFRATIDDKTHWRWAWYRIYEEPAPYFWDSTAVGDKSIKSEYSWTYDTWYVNVEPISFLRSTKRPCYRPPYILSWCFRSCLFVHPESPPPYLHRTDDLPSPRKQRTVDEIIAAAAEIRFLKRIALPSLSTDQRKWCINPPKNV